MAKSSFASPVVCASAVSLFAGLALAGCQTTEADYKAQTARYEQKVAITWVGASPASLTESWGKAHEVRLSKDGPELLYQMSRIYGASDYIVPNSIASEVPAPGGGTALAVNDTPLLFPSRARALKRNCQTEFLIGADGLIDSINARGACLPGDVDRSGAPYRMVMTYQEDIYRRP